MSDAQIKPNTETLGLGDRERFYPFGQSERTGEQDLSNLSSPKSKSREFLCGYGVGEGRKKSVFFSVSENWPCAAKPLGVSRWSQVS